MKFNERMNNSSPIIASAVIALSSVSVIGNLRRMKCVDLMV